MFQLSVFIHRVAIGEDTWVRSAAIPVNVPVVINIMTEAEHFTTTFIEHSFSRVCITTFVSIVEEGTQFVAKSCQVDHVQSAVGANDILKFTLNRAQKESSKRS